VNVFRFDEVSHEYWLNSVRIPSVTQILDGVGLISDFAKQPLAAERGKLIHLACKYLANGVLDWSTVDASILGYVCSYAKFLEHTAWKILAVEQSLHDPEYLFAGTYDVLFSDYLVDIKSGAPAKWHALQTAAYRRLASWAGAKATKRATVYLQEDGSIPNIIEHNDRTDLARFLACRTVYELLERK